MITSQEINKLAGLLEGEGYFGFHKTSHTPNIKLKMSDQDVVEWAASLLGGKVYTGAPAKIGWKVLYTTHAWGHQAAGWMMTLYSLMGKRRQAKIREILTQWRLVTQAQRGGWKSSECHPERRYAARGLCASCYEKGRYEFGREKAADQKAWIA